MAAAATALAAWLVGFVRLMADRESRVATRANHQNNNFTAATTAAVLYVLRWEALRLNKGGDPVPGCYNKRQHTMMYKTRQSYIYRGSGHMP